MKIASILAGMLVATMLGAQSVPDETEIRKIIQEEVATWNKGDAEAYSRHFAIDGTFTNILGMFFTGHEAFATGTKRSSSECFAELSCDKTLFRSSSFARM